MGREKHWVHRFQKQAEEDTVVTSQAGFCAERSTAENITPISQEVLVFDAFQATCSAQLLGSEGPPPRARSRRGPPSAWRRGRGAAGGGAASTKDWIELFIRNEKILSPDSEIS